MMPRPGPTSGDPLSLSTEVLAHEADRMRVVVTGGGTIAPIDDVRHITNVSSGRLAATITEACLDRGAEVWHVHAPGAAVPLKRTAQADLDAPDFDAELQRLARLRDSWREHRSRLHLRPLRRGTIADYAATLEEVVRTARPDAIFLAIAASDYEPEHQPGKIDSREEALTVRLRATQKVIRRIREWAPESYLIGFKLLVDVSHDVLIRTAEDACRVNHAQLTVANDLREIKAGRHTLYLVRPGHPVEVVEPGPGLGGRLVERAWGWIADREPPPAS